MKRSAKCGVKKLFQQHHREKISGVPTKHFPRRDQEHQAMKHQERENELQEAELVPPKLKPNSNEKGRVNIEFYTDPLCCWSWAFEKSWRQLLSKYGDQISYRYMMCGMIPNWDSYNDGMNAVSKPIQMGPVWMHASEVTHVKMRYDIWHLDPPTSSYPPCIAVKTAALQSSEAADRYLFEMRRCLMEDAVNISKPEVLLSIAKRIQSIDFEKFKHDWNT